MDTFHRGMQMFRVHLKNLDSHRNHRSPMLQVYVTEIKLMDHNINNSHWLIPTKCHFYIIILSKRVQEIKIIIIIGNLWRLRDSYHCTIKEKHATCKYPHTHKKPINKQSYKASWNRNRNTHTHTRARVHVHAHMYAQFINSNRICTQWLSINKVIRLLIVNHCMGCHCCHQNH